MAETELSVVCKSCGSEVSPYVTECPYCGSRLRKRAPKLERRGDELAAKEKKRRRLRPRLPKLSKSRVSVAADRPYATIALIAAPAILILVIRAMDRPLVDFGAIAYPVSDGPLGQVWWHYLTAPFVYNDIGYLFVVGCGIALFGSALERRLGTIATLLLAVACGALGMLAADGIETALAGESHIIVALGGNGIALGLLCAYALIRAAEVRAFAYEEVEVIGIAVAATVIFALPLVVDDANVFAGIGGAVVGGLAGLVASYGVSRRGADE
jgi:membrane associated rhomboid family serine protease/DNA-directed RNA polymerase subunit RPC12/RpoP